MTRRPFVAWVGAAVAVGTFLRLVHITTSLWSDEVYTLQLARKPWLAILTEPDQTPPLYALLLHGWRAVAGEAEWVLRLPSLAASVAAIVLVAILGRRLAGARAGTLAAWLAALNPLLVLQGHELRGYALLTLLCVAGALLLLRAADTGRLRDRAAWVLVAALALYTHLFAAFFLLGQAAFWWLRLRDRIPGRQAAGMAGAVALAFLPWAAVLVGRIAFVTGGFWIGPTDWQTLAVTACALAGGWLALTVAVALLATVATTRPNPTRPAAAYVALVGVPILVPLAISLALPVFTPRYVVPAVALACIGLASLCLRVPRRALLPCAAALLLATVASVPGAGPVPFPLDFRQDWRAAVQHLEAEATVGEPVVWLPGLCDSTRVDDLTCPVGVYGGHKALLHVAYGDPARRPGLELWPQVEARLANATSAWLVQADTSVPDPSLQDAMAAHFGKGAEAWRATGVLVVHYGPRSA